MADNFKLELLFSSFEDIWTPKVGNILHCAQELQKERRKNNSKAVSEDKGHKCSHVCMLFQFAVYLCCVLYVTFLITLRHVSAKISDEL